MSGATVKKRCEDKLLNTDQSALCLLIVHLLKLKNSHAVGFLLNNFYGIYAKNLTLR